MSKNTSYSAPGLASLLTVLFVALKLIPYQGHHIIDWPWWVVLAPIWGSAVLAFLLIAFAGVIYIIATKD